MTFDRPFEIHDDIEVLKRLGMSHGLDSGQVADEDVEKIKQCLPPALRVYVDQIIDEPMREQYGAFTFCQSLYIHNFIDAAVTVNSEIVDRATTEEQAVYDEMEHKYEVLNSPSVIAPSPSMSAISAPATRIVQPTQHHHQQLTPQHATRSYAVNSGGGGNIVTTSNMPPTVVVTRRAVAQPTQRGVGGFAQPVGYARPMLARGGSTATVGASTRTYMARATHGGVSS